MIRDRIFIGITDKVVSEKFQMTADLTLSKAFKVAWQCEMTEQQMASEPLEKTVDLLTQNPRHKREN